MRDGPSNPTVPQCGKRSVADIYATDVEEELTLFSIGSSDFLHGFHPSEPCPNHEAVPEWAVKNQDRVLRLIESNLNKAQPSNLKRKVFNTESVPRGSPRPITTEMLDRVIDFEATPQELYDLEGSLVKLAVSCSEHDERYSYLLMWAMVYSEMCGFVWGERFLADLDAAYKTRGARTKCSGQVTLKELWARSMTRFTLEFRAWNRVLQSMFDLRSKIREPLDVMSCGNHAAYLCPEDDAFDHDATRSRYCVTPLRAAKRRLPERELSAEVFLRGRAQSRLSNRYEEEDSEEEDEEYGAPAFNADIVSRDHPSYCNIHGGGCRGKNCNILDPIVE